MIKGKTVSLYCSVDHPGRPDNITYVWRRGQHKLDTTTSNLTFTANLASRSNFSCYAINEGGASNTATTFINVSGTYWNLQSRDKLTVVCFAAPPKFIQTLPPYTPFLSSSENMSLTCRVECYPLCSITWYKDNEVIKNNHPLYDIRTIIHEADTNRSDLESAQSTLVR